MPKVSVIVPNYNHACFLRQRIDSILAQTFQDFELILLDDRSTDDSRSILSSYSGNPHVSAIEFNEKNSGSTFKQWNKGVRLARGEYVWIAESDDYADPRLLERLICLLESGPRVAYGYCRSWRISDSGEVQGYGDYHLYYLDEFDPLRWTADYHADGCEECRNYFVRTNPVPNASAVLFRRSVYESVGGADENLRLCGDWKLWAAMALVGEIAYVAEPLNHFRFHEDSVRTGSQRQALAAAEYLHVVRWLLGQVTPTEQVREKLRRSLPWGWTPAVATWHMPLGRRCAILRDAIAIDPSGTLPKLVPAGLTALRLKFLRHWRSIYPVSKVT